MRIDLESVLWRTRGHTWDYSFVLRPVHPHLEAWYNFHTDAFAGVAASTDATSVGGVLVTSEGEELRFVATTFQDPTLKDVAGRPVAHYLVWFPNIDGTECALNIAPDWGAQVVRAFGDHFRTAFASDDVSDDDLLATARSFVKEVQLSSVAGVVIQFERRVVEKKKRQAIPPTSKTNRALLVTSAVGVLILAIAIYMLMRR